MSSVAKSALQKLKIMYLARLFLEESDEEHPLTMEKILASLSEQGIKAERKSVYDDIEQLRLFGMDIVSVKGGGVSYGYYIGARTCRIETACRCGRFRKVHNAEKV